MEGLKFFGTLSLLSIIIAVLLFFIWKRFRNWSVVLGIVMIYYWSLAGAWFIIYDQLTFDSSIRWGVHYHYYFQKLFHIILNNDYLLTIFAYALFIIFLEASLLFFPFKKLKSVTAQKPIWIYHPALIAIALLALCGSIFFNYNKIIEAINFGESIYLYTRLHQGRFFSLHQLCNEVAVCTLLMGIAILISGSDAVFIKAKWAVKYLVIYILSFTIVMLYLVILGNKHDFLFGGLLGLFQLQKAEWPQSSQKKCT